MHIRRDLANCLVTLLVLLVGTRFVIPAQASERSGVHPDRIVVGQSAALGGPAAALGQGMQRGLEAAFAEANAAGGVHGRTLALISLDDGYEPDRAIANTNRLIDEHDVFALIGEVGTPTAKAVQPIATEHGVPFVGPFTGAGFLRDPDLRNVINVRSSYDAETEAWVAHLTGDLAITRIAILYQDDSFGRAGLSGVQKAMDKRGLTLAAEGTYQRNTTAVKTALLAIRRADPEAVVMVGAYKPIATFVRLARRLRMDPVFVTISFVGSAALAEELGADGAGVVVTQVVPFPHDTNLPLVARYHAALSAHDSEAVPGFVSLEGYLVGRLFIEALTAAGPQPERSRFLQAVYETGRFDLGGVTLTYGSGDNQGMNEVFLTVLHSDGSFEPVQTLSR